LARELGDMEREHTALINLGVALTPLGDYARATDSLHQSMALVKELKNTFSESTVLVNLAWVATSAGNWELAREYAEKGVTMKRDFGHVEALGEGLLWLGHAWVGLGNIAKAIPHYHESRAIRREVGQTALEMGVLAALARAELVREDLSASQGYVEEIMTYLKNGEDFTGTWEPIRLYFSSYQTLKRGGDPRAFSVLETAHDILEKQAALIPEGPDRQRFLEAVPWNRALGSKWAAQIGKSPPKPTGA
jgi:tetratricopeptide (TPR) repeat protein